MNATDRKRLVTTLMGAYAFYDRELTEFAIRIWSDALHDVPVDAVEEAFARHLRDHDAGRFCPKPADILRQLHGDVETRALVAWGSVLSRSRDGGGFLPDHCSATRQAVHGLGGWGAIGRSDEREMGFLQRRFVELFKAYRKREVEGAPVLGLEVAEVLRIGGGKA